ncbi:ABC transporter substrate-binding protein [Schnuerera sp. xch1]|uniref:ABC transporter substrate-binding protein n=1 Tax=Schnuerera sp. xch1 TaxID=2874283 RepID=UPI001CBAABED|nr:ABC transporter substrate-binding protein [Schnuerera sp. xch1]MBZ2174706.1 ABC transporter substrate-binding protein [Schnuerera sp. xch1]
MYGKSIKVGFNGGFCTAGPSMAGIFGYFEEEGIDIEVISAAKLEDAVGTNQVQIITGHIASFLVPTVNGVNMVFASGAHTGCKSLYVLTDSGIDSTEGLAGKTIGVPNGIGDSDHNIGLRFLNRDNIDVDDVKFRPVESSAVILAMESDEVQGAILSDQFAAKFVEEGKIKHIRSLSYDEDFQTEACCVHAFNGDFVRENPISAKKATRAIKRAERWIENNKEEAQMLFDNDWVSRDFDLVVRMMEACNFGIDDETTETTLVNVLDDYKKFGIIQSEETTDELLDRVWNPLLGEEDKEIN